MALATTWTRLAALVSFLATTTSAQRVCNSTERVPVHWLDGAPPTYHSGTSFGLPWARGKHPADGVRFTIADGTPLQSWVTAYWPDGSIKWSGHAVPGGSASASGYTVVVNHAGNGSAATRRRQDVGAGNSGLIKSNSADQLTVDTGKITVVFPKSGSVLVRSIQTSGGKAVGENGRLVLHSQSGVSEGPGDRATIGHSSFESSIEQVTVSDQNSVRALVTVRGKHQAVGESSHAAWIPFVLRFYLYSGSEAVRIVHSVVFDGDAGKDFISGMGIRFDVPLAGEKLYDRHVRIAGVDGGLLAEAVKGITGLRRDPGAAVRRAQFDGTKTPDESTWDMRATSRLKWIPDWNDYSLSQLSPDGFTLKKRTKAGQGWVPISGGTRSGGLAYLGGATTGGLAVGLRDFWKKHPTGLDIRNAATDKGELTLWLYSPEAQPLDLRPFHDGLGQQTYADQLDALEITYEDWEAGFNTPYGIARTNEVFLFGLETTPSRQRFSNLAEHVNEPPVLVATPERYQESGAIGTYWSLPGSGAGNNNNSAKAAAMEKNLDFLVRFYSGQVEQRRWYGFLDYGDFMHTYDADRHTWRYDVGGYGWDNSELSPDLFFWLQFLRTGKKEVYRFAEAQTRHTGEVDVYHLGKWKGLGTRHGVQHWSDSAKQARISTPQYRKIFYYVSGGDERVGELLEETLEADKTFAYLDPRRKVRGDSFLPSETAADIGLGTDWGALAAGWLIEVERRGPRREEALDKLTKTMTGIAALKFGFVTGQATYSPRDGTLGPPPGDPTNQGSIGISHLSAMFGLVEVVQEILEHLGGTSPRQVPDGFEAAWLDYCVYYSGTAAQQTARYGRAFTGVSLRQGHSRLTAFAARRLGEQQYGVGGANNATLASRAWAEFYGNDGLRASLPWSTTRVKATDYIGPAEEASWMSSNDIGLYGCAAIENLQFVPEALERATPN